MRSKYRWVIVVFVAFITLINYLDRSAVSYATAPITSALHINNFWWGIIGSAFSIGYLVLAFVGGPIVDRFGVKRVWTSAAAVWSIVTILTAGAASAVGLFIIRVLLGVSEGPAFPAVTRAMSRWLPNQERGKALGLIVGAGVPFSLMIGGPVVTALLGGIGWKGTFVILGLLGLLWVVLWLGVFRDTPSQHKRVNAAEREYIEAGQIAEEKETHLQRTQWGKIFKNGNLWWSAFGYFAWGFMFWAFMYWLPGYLGQVYKLNLAAVGAFSVLPWAAGTVGAVLGGYLVDVFYKRRASIRTRFITMGVAILLAGASLIPIIASPSLGVSITFISLGIGFGMVTGPLWWVVSIDAAPEQPAAAAGFVDAAFALSGIVAPALMGFVSQATGSFSSGFMVMIILALLSGLGLLLFTRERGRQASALTVEEVNESGA
ncbi:MFS transporter [Alicyclobacillus cycloheptanicus]|uniref:Sugar phosphate permease n=1 Tax=Alicyclobacillus cycloheptanicus TaxID=1457 RepID=A0ABT9XHZ4_9BACL|nr:MFS transporter [Alicyclobacillus cycloheptanicus]MDQ0189915.1 sugar phosphate permease [Alicyclobacillus cycloheptanicus]WDM02182.1 MFS transporter [Alicyclobacillus cycloheptanicus]